MNGLTQKTITVALKLDIKIDMDGKLGIIDIGDGPGAGTKGFEPYSLHATQVRDLCAPNNAALATILGELSLHSMQPETMHIPFIQRQIPAKDSWFDISDLPASDDITFLPDSYTWRIQSTVAHFWDKKSNRVAITPIGLMGMERHKLLWYTLMQQHMPATHRANILFWPNDEPIDTLDLSTIDMTNGAFIKIVDHSMGGGEGVYYAENASAVSKRLHILSQLYQSSNEDHIYVIEPAYQTIKSSGGKDYNVTGRAFVTLTLDTQTHELQVKIAAAKWMFPMDPLQAEKTQDQMLANVGHSNQDIPFLDLTPDELATLSQQIIDVYGDIFTASMVHDDLIEYCKDSPIVAKFQTISQANTRYKFILASSKLEESLQKSALIELIHQDIFTEYLNDDYLPDLLTANKSLNDVYQAGLLTKEEHKKDLIINICALSFYERYAEFIKAFPEEYGKRPHVMAIITHEATIRSTLTASIKQFLKLTSQEYDIEDMDRALRQAAAAHNMVVMKLLIGTSRAEVNALSPQSHQTALDLALKSDARSSMKQSCIRLLFLNGAQQSEFIPTPGKVLGTSA